MAAAKEPSARDKLEGSEEVEKELNEIKHLDLKRLGQPLSVLANLLNDSYETVLPSEVFPVSPLIMLADATSFQQSARPTGRTDQA